ncbi:zinc finger protein ZAT5-like [Musa acuminata AAA Group]|uniref:zinc finger protein ZAT5-like n=1 Tax=Musa acuminata AAA Group TaxID=214697 RepID=UPI0031E317C1
MDPVGEDIGHNIDNNTNSNRQFTPAASVVKGKRTKRRRPVTVAATVPASSAELSSSPIEDDDENMANCLILLSRGHLSDTETTVEEAITEAATATQTKAGLCFYRCKTCDRCLPYFQALGTRSRRLHPSTKAVLE